MDTFDQVFRRATDPFIPEDRSRLDADGLRRARLALAIVMGTTTCSLIASTWLLSNGVYTNASAVAGLALGSVLSSFVLRRTGSLQLTGHAIAGTVAIGLTLLVIQSGARTFPPFALLPIVPMIATLVAGTRAGVIWAALAAIQVGCFYWLFERGLEPWFALREDFIDQGRFMAPVIMLVFVLIVLYCYERLQARALVDLEEERSRQIETRDRFLSHVSHELRTPVAAAQQFVSLVLDGVAGNIEDQQREYLEAAVRNTSQLVVMIDDLVAVSRTRSSGVPEDLEMEEMNLPAPIRDAVAGRASAAAARDVSIVTELPADLPKVRANPKAFADVLDRLLDNAIKFSPKAGSVRVTAAAPSSGEVRIEVVDHGPGIDAEHIETIFGGLQPGSTPDWQSRKGLGVGLAICRDLVRAMGGRINVESDLDCGSRFSIVLPAVEQVGNQSNERGRP